MMPLNHRHMPRTGFATTWRPLLLAVTALCWTLGVSQATADVSQTPLLLGGGNVPGNLALVPSVEHPTVISVANLGAYNNTSTYTGYFDSGKCYSFIEEEFNHVFFGTISKENGGGYFTPVSEMNSARDCSGNSNAKWSGNYLNWATTQTIDPFRKALTGGYRVVDTTSMTILEKATRGNSSNYFGNRTIDATNANKTTPFGSVTLTSSVTSGSNDFQKNKTVRFTYSGSDNKTVTKHFTVRVEVCKKGLLESNCTKYGENLWKPEGLIQQYSKDIRYSVFSYLNENGNTRNGGVMRAPQGYVGQTKREPGTPNELPNELKEWSDETGIFYVNPRNDSVGNSGVINYINKFGELTNRHKSNDPVSELYYAALRYFRNLGDVAAYSKITDEAQRDKFPVITNWTDPIQYSCQKNVILGIGDVNSHEDRDLPVTGDPLNVQELTQKVFDLEGINKNASSEFTGRGNSAHIAGLAYYANTADLREDRAGKQTISTHWVDVREDEKLLEKARNQYWLAAKYGGFQVPDDYEFGDTIDQAWWWTNGETLDPTNDKRPDNFYVASDATRMVESLKAAFAKIAKDVSSTTAALSTNSTKLETDTVVFQSMLDSADWSGDLLAKAVASNGKVSETPTWKAAEKLDALTDEEMSDRSILTSLPPTIDTTSGALISTTGRTFSWDQLSSAQQDALRTTVGGTLTTEEVGQNRLAFIRGVRTMERTDAAPNNPFRQRGSRLGDIANSDPQYIHKQNFGYSQLPETAGFTAAAKSAYTTFRASSSYQNRPPLVVVGANDGMLHGFNASLGTNGGKELFAYVPNDLIDELYELTDPTYSHRYYVDGTPRIGDAWVGNAWKTLVIGSSGAGGRSIFALDISNPESMSSSSVLWEFTHPEMGYSLGRPSLVPLYNGKFGVVVTSGYDRPTSTTSGYVWLLDAADGSVLKRFELPNSGDLGSPLVVDLDNDRVADRIYVADTNGNVWRLDTNSTSTGNWDAPSSLKAGGSITPLFIAKDSSGARQPITAPLDAAYTKDRKIMLVFGTGSFYQTTDNEIPESPQVQSFYGIIDSGTSIDGRGNLLEQEILKEVTGTELNGRAVSQNTLEDRHLGWYLDLQWKKSRKGPGPKGERVISQAQLGGNRVTFSTLIPAADPCLPGGTSWIMSLDLATGSRLVYSYFDYNGDGKIDESDYIKLDDGTKVPVSGVADPDEGAVKGTIGLNDQKKGKRYLCYASSASSTDSDGVTPVCIEVMGDNSDSNRLSWHEVRSNL
ncbi:pilus assembly protein [Stutzerimonas kunmingensis]|uniref:pilus assembly protein n=1 Tax=Stutzerimonas kunmingensis TaxID=1211807 RepID=UPI001FC9162D|nr:PilC/PilY family type IV pilus protein [Stutzerimonas kunmingensis]MCQ2043192.1 PilC/PilY family type IV pilus protein [Stutzerimonas kunmingensis]